MVKHSMYLNELFDDNIDELMWELSEEYGYFTNYEFVRKVSQRHKRAYIEFLYAILEDRGDEYPFNITHQAIGKKLSEVAQALGYQQDKNSGEKDWNIFGNPENAVLYRRTDAVQEP